MGFISFWIFIHNLCRWLKKQGIESMEIFSDEKREFMRQYTALGEKVGFFLLTMGMRFLFLM
jgi:hypothetical protein